MHSRFCEICILTIFYYFTVIDAINFIVNGRPRNGMVGEPDFIPSQVPYTSNIELIVQQLDNFDPDNYETWSNRYYSNKEFYEEGGPIFLMFRGETSISPDFMVSGSWVDYAIKYKAMLYQLEHRYYGESIPTSDLSTQNLVYLTFEQALADAANFIRQMNMENSYQPDQKWIAFGGSYGGALAIWSRDIYPDLIWGAVSSSGTVNAIVNFKEYYVDVSATISNYSMKCGKAIQSAFQTITEMLKTAPGKIMLNQTLPLCESLVNVSNLDISNLMVLLAGSISYVIQYSHELVAENNVSLKELCEIMENNLIGSPIERLSSAIHQVLTEQQETCVEFNYEKFISYLQNVSPDGTGGARQWWYQQCNEFGFFQDSNSHNQIFGHYFQVDYYLNECTKIFGQKFNSTYVYRGANRTNLYYGGNDPKNVTNVLSVVGSADPYLATEISRNLTNSVQALLINGTAHCADMYSADRFNLPQITMARSLISQFIGDILSIGETSHNERSVEREFDFTSLNSLRSMPNNYQPISSHHIPQIQSIPFVALVPTFPSYNFDSIVKLF